MSVSGKISKGLTKWTAPAPVTPRGANGPTEMAVKGIKTNN